MKGGRRVQRQIDFVAVGRRQRRNILILRGTEGVEDPSDIEHRRDVRAVVAVAELRCIACLHRQISARTRSQRLDDGCAVPIVQNERLLAIREARSLQLGNPVEALRIHFDCQASGQERGHLRELGRVGVAEAADRGEIAFQARTVQLGLIEILRGAYERAGTPAHGAHQGPEVAARFRSQEQQHLLRALGHGHRQPVIGAFAGPDLARKEPGLGWGIRRAAQKCRHHQIMGRLRGRQIRFEPYAVPGDEIWNCGKGQRLGAPGDVDLEGRPCKVERLRAGPSRCS